MTQSHTTAKTPASAQTKGGHHDSTTAEVADDSIMAQTDELLDEIDTLLEDVSVLVGFRQRSGQ